MTRQTKTALLLATCGAAAGIASAQPYVVTGSGATLQESLFRAPANTNDFIDLDGDGFTAPFDQLAPSRDPLDFSAAFNGDNFLQFHYRITGSGNGIQELDQAGFAFGPGVPFFDQNPDGFDTDMDGVLADDIGNSQFTDGAVWNRVDLVTGGSLVTTTTSGAPFGNVNHRSGVPFVAKYNPAGTPIAGYEAQALDLLTTDNGFNIDFSSADVPLAWFGITGGQWRANSVPGSAGYGGNPRLATWKDGSTSLPVDLDADGVADDTDMDGNPNFTTQANLLRPLSNLNTNFASPDEITVYSTAISLVAVASPVNYGVGLSEIQMSDLRHLAATGRRLVGENLMKITRDSGSGTRNAFMNGIGIDPAWGAGENIGRRTGSGDSQFDRLGPGFIPSNKAGSSRMDGTVQNHRLAVGHTGAERFASASRNYFGDQDFDLLGIVADLKGGTVAARPTAGNVIDGGPDGYNVVGPASFSHRGDPGSNSAAVGGYGFLASDLANPAPTTPAMDNAAAAGYLNNIRRSITAFSLAPADPTNFGTPGEFLATSFFLTAGPDNLPESEPSSSSAPIPIVPNAGQNGVVRADALANSVLNEAGFASFNSSTAGRVPDRTTGFTYSDGVAGGGNYIDQAGNSVGYRNLLTMRNKIAADFNGDGVRSAADAGDMIAAWDQRNGGPAWVAPDGIYGAGAGNDAVIEILGDFDGDGSFDTNDVRYWADGLVLDTAAGLDVLPAGTVGPDGVVDATLNRTAGYTAVDNAFGGNFFGTVLANGTYDAGDSRADIAGNATTPGFDPVGHDGIVDAADIDYVYANFGDWTDLGDAAGSFDTDNDGVFETARVMDLSADMNGDLVVDIADADEILTILETTRGDVDLDGVYDGSDRGTIEGNLGLSPAGYADGDLNGDGEVTIADLDVVCYADFAAPFGLLDFFDVLAYLSAFDAQSPAADVAAPAGAFDFFDVLEFLAQFDAGC